MPHLRESAHGTALGFVCRWWGWEGEKRGLSHLLSNRSAFIPPLAQTSGPFLQKAVCWAPSGKSINIPKALEEDVILFAPERTPKDFKQILEIAAYLFTI